MSNKLYEANTIAVFATELRKKIKEYYTFPGDNTVDTANVENNYDGMKYPGTGSWKCKDHVYSSGSFTPTYVYDNMFKIAEVGSYAIGDASDPTPTQNVNPKKYYLGINKLITRFGFPANEYWGMGTITSGTSKTAPDNGWFSVYLTGTVGNNQNMNITNSTNNMIAEAQSYGYCTTVYSGSTNTGSAQGTKFIRPMYIIMPVARYDKIKLTYNVSAANIVCNFIPANKTNTSKTDQNKHYCAFKGRNGQGTSVVAATASTTYNVPNDGWLFYMGSSASNQYCEFLNNSNQMRTSSYGDGFVPYCILPVSKGASVTIKMSGGTVNFIKSNYT